MKVFLAGASGAIGRPLVDRLVGDGHDVVGTTRDEAWARRLRERGAPSCRASRSSRSRTAGRSTTRTPRSSSTPARSSEARCAISRPPSGAEGIMLRYGFCYGPGTWYDRDGAMATMIRKRRYPIIGNGQGHMSFVHIDDAVDATVRALERGAPGIYNVTDDAPATQKEWLPEAARVMGAKKPFWVPAWLPRRLAGDAAVHYSTTLPGNANDRAKAAFGWTPRPWREGFREVFA